MIQRSIGFPNLIPGVRGALALAAAAVLAGFSLLAAQTGARTVTVGGTVVAADGGAPIPGAEVSAAKGRTLSGTDGGFRLRGLAPGQIRLMVRAVGFQEIEAEFDAQPGDSIMLTIEMLTAAQPLAPVIVRADEVATARLVDFERRRTGGLGRYITRDQIEHLHPILVSQLLRMLPSGVLIQDSAGIPLAVSQRGPKVLMNGGVPTQTASCVLRLAIDGQLQPWGTTLDLVGPREVEGIEIYSGPASIPAELASSRLDQACGLILIWTRSARIRP